MSKLTESEAKIEKWTTKEVHQWLKTTVNIPHLYADKLLEEEVSGEEMVCFKKQDLLDMEIKHGPAVKIFRYLDELRRGSQHASKYPAYVDKWTKEQVCYWLLDKVKVYEPYTDRLLKEEVSGDCLVCFSKKDLIDLQIKHGPAVKILAKLSELDRELEPELQAPTHFKTDPEDQQKHHRNSPVSLLQTSAAQTEPPQNRTGENPNDSKSTEYAEPKKKGPKHQAMGPERPTVNENRGTHRMLILYLEELLENDFKKFTSLLRDSKLTGFASIPHGHLEKKDRIGIADLMIKYYGGEALQVTLKILKQIDHNDLAQRLERNMGEMATPNPKAVPRREANQGDKLKNLLTCGGNSLDHYDRFVVVMNKCQKGQVENLEFLSKLKLFCVLDFDPNSAAPGGVCSFYRKSRVANLHGPTQFQSEPEDVIKNLNLGIQTSWVFCNGRNDITCEANKELSYKEWFRTARGDIEQIVSFICKPEVLQSRTTLVIFLLLSPVHTDKDAVFDTFTTFYSRRKGENIVSICESQSTFDKWRDMIKDKCDCDITKQAVYLLTMSEINGAVMTLGPHNQSCGRSLPSSDSSSVILKQKDEDYMTALDILCENQCENVYDEKSTDFQDHKIKMEEEFYRGGKAKWWNFYFSDQVAGVPH
ncbi:sterile alpha motif domain-containing protein 9-like isoform X2 [Hypomesus transpacificus]|uniref:sterile alpha motif domain-containing protein 9-like isoform X2 n=1 Tax=Hypomesus transpacificus TaxID=137520 RepID=UPI001F07B67C|nr:sterile alpha motif domain-containing protein 9-like isoform X2 [Hypomesus transpacificus]